MIKLIKCKNYKEVSDKAFEIMKEVLDNKKVTLGLATGSAPIGIYERLVDSYNKNETTFKDVTTFNLDEYIGLDINHSESYSSFMKRNLFSQVDINMDNVYLPKNSTDPKFDDEYEKLLGSHQIDLQLLGLGSNGHIGFNEPGTPFDSLTHIVELNESTLQDNSRFFDNDISKVPTKARSMGLATIMKSKKILLVATSTNKAQAISDMINGEVTIDCPASILQNHPDVTVIIDEEAAKLL
jgi:glucosamine-6-phosphate deaminase